MCETDSEVPTSSLQARARVIFNKFTADALCVPVVVLVFWSDRRFIQRAIREADIFAETARARLKLRMRCETGYTLRLLYIPSTRV